MLIPAVGTAVGALVILAVGRPSDRTLGLLLGLTAGVMLAATSFSLLEPALERGPLWEVAVGFVLGGASLAALDTWLPHAHERFAERGHAPAGLAPRRRALIDGPRRGTQLRRGSPVGGGGAPACC